MDTRGQSRGVSPRTRRTPLEPARQASHDPPVSTNGGTSGRLREEPPERPGIDPERLSRHARAQVAAAPPLAASRIERLRRAFLPRVGGRVSKSDVGR